MPAAVREGRFVVLRHDWEGVHWDFMLEAGQALRTWSLPAPPSPGVEQEARALPDHRLAYLTYEGPVSGDRGVVTRVAEGTFQAMTWEPLHVQVRLAGAQLVGEVDLRGSDSDRTAGSTWIFRLGKVV